MGADLIAVIVWFYLVVLGCTLVFVAGAATLNEDWDRCSSRLLLDFQDDRRRAA